MANGKGGFSRDVMQDTTSHSAGGKGHPSLKGADKTQGMGTGKVNAGVGYGNAKGTPAAKTTARC
jgi:hypothetical protein